MTGRSWWMAVGCFVKTGRGKRGVGDTFYVKNVECIEVNCGDCGITSGSRSKGIQEGSYSRHLPHTPNQDNKASATMFESLR